MEQKFEAKGLDGIKLGYQGSSSYLTSEQRVETITMLQTRNYFNLDELVTYLDEHYGVIYKSKQSYYELLSAAGISCNKSQKINPIGNPELVKKARRDLEFLDSESS